MKRELTAIGWLGVATAMIGASLGVNGWRTDDRGVWSVALTVAILGALIAVLGRE